MADVVIAKKNEVHIKLKCEPHILYELHPYFTFEVSSAKYMKKYRKGWNGLVTLLSVTTGEVYAGLLDRVIAKLKAFGYSYEFEHNKYYGSPFEVNEEITKEGVEGFLGAVCKTLTPYDYQINAVYECLRYNRKTIVSATSSGKSYIIYGIVRYHLLRERKCLVVFPTTGLIKQMFSDWKSYGWNPEKYCHLIYDGAEKRNDSEITLSTWQSLDNCPKSFFEEFDCIIVDECHGCKAKSLTNIMKNCHQAKYRYGFTGTLTNGGEDSKTHEWVISGLFGPSYKAVGTKELIEKGRASQLDIQCIVLKHTPRHFESYQDEIKYLIENEKRNRFIKNLALDIKGNTLILFERVETHGQILFDLINNDTEKHKIYLVHGGVDADEREEIRNIVERENNAIIVASYGVFSTGVSIKNLHNLIFASPFKSRIRNMQSIGRLLRLNHNKKVAKVYDLSDDITFNGKTNYTLKHFMERVKNYNEEGFDYDIKTIKLGE
jgi:superfamily II DNA or RNA helicase